MKQLPVHLYIAYCDNPYDRKEIPYGIGFTKESAYLSFKETVPEALIEMPIHILEYDFGGLVETKVE